MVLREGGRACPLIPQHDLHVGEPRRRLLLLLLLLIALCFLLLDLLDTRLRSPGAGVSFNFGRILTASLIFITPAITHLFDGNYAHIGRITSLVFVIGMIAILFAPDTSKRDMKQ